MKPRQKSRHYLKKGVSVVVWDHGPSTIDRYTVVCYGREYQDKFVNDQRTWHAALFCSEGGLAFSQWGEITLSEFRGGKRVAWESLSKETQDHITWRVLE